MKPCDGKSNTCIDFSIKNNDKDPKFNIGDRVRVSKYKNNFCKRLHSKFV